MARPLAAALCNHPLRAGAPAHPADQAAGLRHLLRNEPQRRLRVLAVTGSAVRSGKSAIVAELARHAAPSERVLVLDQTANEVARHAGLMARHDLFDVVSGRLGIEAVAVKSGGWRLVPAQRGLAKLAAAGTTDEALFTSFLRLREPVSLLFLNVDGAQGWLPQLVADGNDVLLVTAPGQAAITAAYARLKELGAGAAHYGNADTRCTIRVLVNGAADYADARRVFRVLADTARNFLDMEPVYAGFLPPDHNGVPFGCSRHAPLPACETALTRLAAAVMSWRLAEYGLPDTTAVE